MPRDEGEFIYIWGGPYDAHKVLGDEFGDLVSENRIQEVVDLVQGDGSLDWAPTSEHPVYLAAIARDDPEDEGSVEETETIDDVLRRLEDSYPVSFGSPDDIAQRKVVRRHLEALRAELARLPPSSPGMGHNSPPPDEEIPSVVDVEVSVAEIGAELDKPEPDAVKVASATLLISRAGKWLRARFDKGVEKEVEDAFRWIGRTAWENKKSLVIASYGLPNLMHRVTDAVVQWIHVIGSLF